MFLLYGLGGVLGCAAGVALLLWGLFRWNARKNPLAHPIVLQQGHLASQVAKSGGNNLQSRSVGPAVPGPVSLPGLTALQPASSLTVGPQFRGTSTMATTQKAAFEITNPGSGSSKVLLYDARLRKWLTDYGLLGTFTRIVPFSRALGWVSYLQREVSYDSSLSPMLTPFVTAIQAEQQRIIERGRALKSEGKTLFEALPYVFTKDEPVVVTSEAGVKHAAVLESITLSNGWGRAVTITYRFVVFNGTDFVFTKMTTHVGEFDGELPFSRLHIAPMTDGDREKFKVRGLRYRQLNIERIQRQYTGQMVRRPWRGRQLVPADGRVMVDVKSFRRVDPNYYGFYGDIANRYGSEQQPAKENDLIYCSPYVYGFSFEARQWGELRVDSLADVQYRDEAFDRVVLESDRKHLMHALVSASRTNDFNDIISGKGGGIIFLLAGGPGVGKTLSAESIAETLHKPLYVIGAGELGTTPEQVEQNLRSALDMASTWGAIVLIDECDVFLERRTKADLERNAMVSIFLRILEYFNGIMFLTTNRVVELDEAFLSRISLALEYHALDEEKRRQVWQQLTPVHRFDGPIDFDLLAKVPLNGREIKNYIRLALALACDEQRPATQEDIQLMLDLGLEFKLAGLAGQQHS